MVLLLWIDVSMCSHNRQTDRHPILCIDNNDCRKIIEREWEMQGAPYIHRAGIRIISCPSTLQCVWRWTYHILERRQAGKQTDTRTLWNSMDGE